MNFHFTTHKMFMYHLLAISSSPSFLHIIGIHDTRVLDVSINKRCAVLFFIICSNYHKTLFRLNREVYNCLNTVT